MDPQRARGEGDGGQEIIIINSNSSHSNNNRSKGSKEIMLVPGEAVAATAVAVTADLNRDWRRVTNRDGHGDQNILSECAMH